MSSRKCLFIDISSSDKYYENEYIVNDAVLLAFPTASEEMRNAGTCLAVSMHTASVFHSMRAAEIGLRSMNSAFPLTIRGSKPLELAEWREILDALSVVARDIENRPNTDQQKEPDQLFMSEASAQFRFFKNVWRVRVAHARGNYDESQARDVLTHVTSFFDVLATRLRE